jgi:hypothetical protein
MRRRQPSERACAHARAAAAAAVMVGGRGRLSWQRYHWHRRRCRLRSSTVQGRFTIEQRAFEAFRVLGGSGLSGFSKATTRVAMEVEEVATKRCICA